MQFNPAELQDELNEVRAEINKLNMPVEEGTKAAGQVTSTTIPGVSRELILKEKAINWTQRPTGPRLRAPHASKKKPIKCVEASGPPFAVFVISIGDRHIDIDEPRGHWVLMANSPRVLIAFSFWHFCFLLFC